MEMIDARLADGQTDGWRYADMPEDGRAWRDTLAYLNEDAKERFGAEFGACQRSEQASVVQAVQDLGSLRWHGLPAQPGVEPVDQVRLHGALRASRGLG